MHRLSCPKRGCTGNSLASGRVENSRLNGQKQDGFMIRRFLKTFCGNFLVKASVMSHDVHHRCSWDFGCEVHSWFSFRFRGLRRGEVPFSKGKGVSPAPVVCNINMCITDYGMYCPLLCYQSNGFSLTLREVSRPEVVGGDRTWVSLCFTCVICIP